MESAIHDFEGLNNAPGQDEYVENDNDRLKHAADEEIQVFISSKT